MVVIEPERQEVFLEALENVMVCFDFQNRQKSFNST